MPLGAGVDYRDTRHEGIIAKYKEPRKLVQEFRERLIAIGGRIDVEELDYLDKMLAANEEDLLDFYWQSSSAECPEDNYRV